MWTIATILNVTSGFALMRYRGGAAEIIATSLIIDAALAPLTATIASRRGRSLVIWSLLGFALRDVGAGGDAAVGSHVRASRRVRRRLLLMPPEPGEQSVRKLRSRHACRR